MWWTLHRLQVLRTDRKHSEENVNFKSCSVCIVHTVVYTTVWTFKHYRELYDVCLGRDWLSKIRLSCHSPGMVEHFFTKSSSIFNVPCSVVDPNTLNLDPDSGFWPNLDPDPGLYNKFLKKKFIIIFYVKSIFFKL